MTWLLLYGCALFLSCLGLRSKAHDSDTYFVYNRQGGAGIVTLSLLASSIGGSATLGMIGLAWQVGAPAFWWLGSGVLGLSVLGLILAGKIRKSGVRTMPELCQKQLGESFRTFCGVLIALSYIPIVAAQFSSLALIIAQLGGIDYITALFAGTAALLCYTGAGGQTAVMKSDVWQFFILAAALVIILYFCLTNPTGLSALNSTKLTPVNGRFPLSRLVYFLVILVSSFIVGPMLYGRLLSAKDEQQARNGSLNAALGLFLIACVITAAGICMQGILPAALFPPEFRPEDITGIYLKEQLPAWAGIFCFLGLLSAVVSSADSCLFTAASICANDLFKNPSISACRLSMLGITCCALALSLLGKGILALLLMANDIYVCGVVPPVFVSLVCSERRIGNHCLILAMLTGSILGITGALLEKGELSVAGVFISLTICLAGARKTDFGKNAASA